MCKYTVLAQNSHGIVRWCHHCEAFHLAYNNITMNLKPKAFEQFKCNLEDCYYDNMEKARPKCRNIIFDTPIEGINLIFTHREVGDFLALVQDAVIAAYPLVE